MRTIPLVNCFLGLYTAWLAGDMCNSVGIPIEPVQWDQVKFFVSWLERGDLQWYRRTRYRRQCNIVSKVKRGWMGVEVPYYSGCFCWFCCQKWGKWVNVPSLFKTWPHHKWCVNGLPLGICPMEAELGRAFANVWCLWLWRVWCVLIIMKLNQKISCPCLPFGSNRFKTGGSGW